MNCSQAYANFKVQESVRELFQGTNANEVSAVVADKDGMIIPSDVARRLYSR